MKKQYYIELSLLSIFYCLLVIFIHSSAQPVTLLPKSTIGYLTIMPIWRMAGCAVTGFFFLSGFKFTLNHSKDFNYTLFIVKRLRTIFLPYCVFSIIYYLYGNVGSAPGLNFWDLFVSVVSGDAAGHLYFIIALLQFYILAPLWLLFFKRFSAKIILTSSLIFTIALGFVFPVFFPYNFSNRFFVKYLLFWILGCYFGLNANKLRETAAKMFKPLLFTFVIFAFADVFLFLHSDSMLLLSLREFVRVIYCTSAAFFFYSLSVKISLCMKKYSLVNTLSASTFTAYLIHPLIISCIDRLLVDTAFGLLDSFIIRLVATIVTTGFISVVWVLFKRRFLRKAK